MEAAPELAWTTNLVRPDEKGAGFVDVKTGKTVQAHEAHAAYEAHILAHGGVRVMEPDCINGL